jgi:uncharacterized protein DUF6788
MTSSQASILEELMRLAPLCSGSLHEQYLTCGKPNCACHDKDDPQLHGPYIIWARRIGGKQVNRTFRAGPEVEKIKEGIANYHRMQELVGRLVRIGENEVLGEEETGAGGKKNFRPRLRK